MPSNPASLYSTNRARSTTAGKCDSGGACSPAMTVCYGDVPDAACGYWLDELADGFVGPWSESPWTVESVGCRLVYLYGNARLKYITLRGV
jgi:hypothetical protein